MAKSISLTKRSLITKANQTMVIITSIAAFVTVFSLVASKALLSQTTYQNRVISQKKKALKQLKDDLGARDSLVSSYKTFVGAPQNLLGGNPTGTGSQDGDNAKLILDALPSKYDFPALATSLEKILTGQNLQIASITGTDDEVLQQKNQTSSAPKPVPMPFKVSVSGSYTSVQSLIGVFEHSIRPFQIQTIDFSGDQSNMTVSVSAQTYYQPEKALNISTELVR